MIRKIYAFITIVFFSTVSLAYNTAEDTTPFGYKQGAYGPKPKSLTSTIFSGLYTNGLNQNFPQGINRITDIWRFGFALGYQIDESFGVESHLSYTPTINNNFDTYTYDAALSGTYDFPLMERFYLYATLGPSVLHFRTPNINNFTRFALQYSLGAKFFLFKNMNLRADIRAMTTFDSANTAFSPSLGLQYYFQSKRRRLDRDGDGIRDMIDQCPDEP
ncbi:MAG: porin family protein, partial [Deltaproteobacteria bacterium]|nr:porin family protein [Deltaproteobacteria bacterium]